jgi:hypothetical protein
MRRKERRIATDPKEKWGNNEEEKGEKKER